MTEFKVIEFKPIVEELFWKARRPRGYIARNPITGEHWLSGYDRPKKHKERAIRALIARACFQWDVQWYAPDAPPLPLLPEEIDDLKSQTGLPYLVAVYTQSLQAQDWHRSGHPDFLVYARAVMANRYAPDYIKDDSVLHRRFPAYHQDLLRPGLVWPVKKSRR